MSRAQSGICSKPHRAALVRVYEVIDMPMNAMSVGQFSVMVHGVIADVLKHYPGDKLKCVVGFGQMFWLLAWHGKRPRRLRTFDDLEHNDHFLPATEGDLWFYFHSSNPQCVRDLAQYMDGHLKGLVTLLLEMESNTDPDSQPLDSEGSVPESIFIEAAETDFARGSFALLQKFGGPADKAARWAEVLKNATAAHDDSAVLIHTVIPGEEGAMLVVFHSDPDYLDAIWESVLEQPETAERLRECPPLTGTRFFIPSIDVLTGLRMGGIRMNRFSPTQQFK